VSLGRWSWSEFKQTSANPLETSPNRRPSRIHHRQLGTRAGMRPMTPEAGLADQR
jgi:hypothetical protein